MPDLLERRCSFWNVQHLLANGVSMKEIQEWLGHSTYNVTANFYSHLDYTAKLASADAISKALEK